MSVQSPSFRRMHPLGLRLLDARPFSLVARHLAGLVAPHFGATVALPAASGVTARETRADSKAVFELFTRQGCSSCPPADKLPRELRNAASIIALSLPIDYLDYLGWKDSLANPKHT